MPSPLTQSIVPPSWLQRAQGAIDQRTIAESPILAGLKGFGAGALEGVADQLTPLNMGLALLPGMGILGRGTALRPALTDAAGRSLGPLARVGPVVKGLTRAVPQGAEDAFLRHIRKP